MTVEEIADAILPWADEHMPEAAEKTRKMAKHESQYRRFLARLITRRYEADKSGLTFALLNESDTVMTVRSRTTGLEKQFRGRYAPFNENQPPILLLDMWLKAGTTLDEGFGMIDDYDLVSDSPVPKPLPKYVPPPVPKVEEVKKPVKRKDPTVVLELLPPEMRSRDD